jgi:hypothetical protein
MSDGQNGSKRADSARQDNKWNQQLAYYQSGHVSTNPSSSATQIKRRFTGLALFRLFFLKELARGL